MLKLVDVNPISINITVENPTVTLPSDTIIQPNQPVSINAQGSLYSAEWSNGFVGNPLQISPSMTNQYTVTVTSQFAACKAPDSIIVKVIDLRDDVTKRFTGTVTVIY